MSVSGATRVAKWILVILNFLVFCAGAIAIGLGAWGLASEYGAQTLKDLTGSELYRGAAIAIIVGGSVLALIAIIGGVGAIIESKWLLGIYFVIMILLLILFVTAAAVGFAFRDKIEEELSKQMQNSLVYQYGVNVNNNDDNNVVTDVWDAVQKKLDCCGVSGGLNSSMSWYIWQGSTWFKQRGVMDPILADRVPSSCCVGKVENSTCQRLNLLNPTQPIQSDPKLVTNPNPALNHQGCIDSLKDKISEHIAAIVGIAVAILIVMLLSVILSVCVCTNIRKSYKSEDNRL
uniref:Tetraspanin n=1 Tax=Arion vulgaris TaxID=1028688 RepID=A0A0B7BS88_9EUPU